MSELCAARHPKGWLCVLLAGHEDEHLSIDNTRLWHGTPGWPVRWSDPSEEVERLVQVLKAPASVHQRLVSAVLPEAPQPGEPPTGQNWTGERCTHCGSRRMIREGTCSKCLNCGETTGCG